MTHLTIPLPMRTHAVRRMAAGLAVSAAVLLAACASYGPGRLPAGATVEQARQSLGVPTAEARLPDGGRRLEYARGPVGKHTFMLYFDADGHLQRHEQVLDETHFNAIRSGMSSDDVLARIGHTAHTRYIGWQKQTVWSYRYDSPFCQWFEVGLDPQGVVVDTAYGPDPACDDDFPFSQR